MTRKGKEPAKENKKPMKTHSAKNKSSSSDFQSDRALPPTYRPRRMEPTQSEATSSPAAPASTPRPSRLALITTPQTSDGGSGSDSSGSNKRKRKLSSTAKFSNKMPRNKKAKNDKPKASPARRHPDDPKKHQPYTPPGTKFTWEANQHIPTKNPCVLGREGRNRDMSLPLVATTGKKYTYWWPHRENMDWNNKHMIAGVHKWRKQIIDRRLPGGYPTRNGGPKQIRPHWSENEFHMLKVLLQAKMEENNGGKVTMKDLAHVVREHNKKLKGKKVHKGESTRKGMNSSGKMSKGSRTKVTKDIPPRTANSAYAQAMRWDDTKVLVVKQGGKNVYRNDSASESDFGDSSIEDFSDVEEKSEKVAGHQPISVEGDMDDDYYTDDSTVEDEEKPPAKKRHRGNLDHHLEDDSDDEHGGQRPAGTQNGAPLIAT